MISIQREAPDTPAAQSFLSAADRRSASLYPAESRHGLSLAELKAAEVRFFVARRQGEALGCGGYMLLDAGAAEMKRLFVDPAARGQGVGSALVEVIEQVAAAEGVTTLFLETGVKSDEALRLYARLGFSICEPFDQYKPDPLSVFMRKQIGRPGRAD